MVMAQKAQNTYYLTLHRKKCDHLILENSLKKKNQRPPRGK